MPRPLVHEIWHGDSVELAKRFHARRQIKSVITDPPFGIDNVSKMPVTPGGKEHARKIANDEDPQVAMDTFTVVMDQVIPGMKDESDIYIFTAGAVLGEWLLFTKKYLPDMGFNYKGIGIWGKPSPGLGDHNTWGQAIEYILYFKRGKRIPQVGKQNFIFGDNTVPPGKLIHPHEKPASLLRKLIEHSTDRGDFLVDPFGGSGSLVRAAKECGRSAVAIELDEKNYRLAKESLDTQPTALF